MKKLLILVLLIAATTTAFAQLPYRYIVYLNDGSSICGMVIGRIQDEVIMVKTDDSYVHDYRMENIERIEIEPIESCAGYTSAPAKTSKIKKPDYRMEDIKRIEKEPVESPDVNTSEQIIEETGQLRIAELSYAKGFDLNDSDIIRLDLLYGYSVSPYLLLGAGISMRYYFVEEVGLTPIFTEIRTYLFDRDFSPYLSLGAGYTFDPNRDFEAIGYLLNPSIGVSFDISDKTAINAGIGYEYHRIEAFYLYWQNSTISFDIGITY